MKLTEEKILNLLEKYDDCIIEEIYENHKEMGNWCIITCDLKEETVDGQDCLIGGIFDLMTDLEKYDNVIIEDDTIENDDGDGYFEYVSIEWE